MNKLNHIRIIQLSDCHLSADPQQQWCGRYPAQYLEKIIEFIKHNETNDYTVIATGDLSHDGSNASYLKLATSMQLLNKPVYSLAGNHDVLSSINNYLNNGLLSSSQKFIKENWLIITLNTNVVGEEYGLLSEEELSFLKDTLSLYQQKHVLIALHHPPVKVNCAWIDKINLHNSDSFNEIIARYKSVKAVIFGHIHQETETVLNEIAYLSTPSTCHQYKPNSDAFCFDDIEPGYRWLELHQDGSLDTGITRVTVDKI